jgi:cell division FtsZ-interacting protein ZapD
VFLPPFKGREKIISKSLSLTMTKSNISQEITGTQDRFLGLVRGHLSRADISCHEGLPCSMQCKTDKEEKDNKQVNKYIHKITSNHEKYFQTMNSKVHFYPTMSFMLHSFIF